MTQAYPILAATLVPDEMDARRQPVTVTGVTLTELDDMLTAARRAMPYCAGITYATMATCRDDAGNLVPHPDQRVSRYAERVAYALNINDRAAASRYNVWLAGRLAEWQDEQAAADEARIEALTAAVAASDINAAINRLIADYNARLAAAAE